MASETQPFELTGLVTEVIKSFFILLILPVLAFQK
jgi:hypothetical protein